jgi:8-oxo-dGTP pyrophosphatase MutT (NUDIX family)
MQQNRFYLLSLLEEEAIRVPPSISTQQIPPFQRSNTISHITHAKSTQTTSLLTYPLTYPDRTAPPFASHDLEETYKQILKNIPTTPQKRRIRFSHPMRASTAMEILESYAIVLISYARGDDVPTVLLGRRRESVEFANFIRGMYDAEELYTLLCLMTIEERDRLVKYSFDELWEDYWPINGRQFHLSKARGIAVVAYERVKPYLSRLLEITRSNKKEAEWLFPRGRGTKHNTGEKAAVSEFQEETKLSLERAVRIPIEPYRELYYGSDGLSYATTHYVYITDEELLPPKREAPSAIRKHMVSNDFETIGWFTLLELKDKVNEYRYRMVDKFVNVIDDLKRRSEISTSSTCDSSFSLSSTPVPSP